jgi:hypothetical protein
MLTEFYRNSGRQNLTANISTNPGGNLQIRARVDPTAHSQDSAHTAHHELKWSPRQRH